MRALKPTFYQGRGGETGINEGSLRGGTKRIQDIKCGVTSPKKHVGIPSSKVESVKGITDEFCQGPSKDHCGIEWMRLCLEGQVGENYGWPWMRELYLKGELFGDSPDKEQTTENLSDDRRKGGSDPTKDGVQNIEDCKALDKSSVLSDTKIGCLSAVVQRKESRWERDIQKRSVGEKGREG